MPSTRICEYSLRQVIILLTGKKRGNNETKAFMKYIAYLIGNEFGEQCSLLLAVNTMNKTKA